MNETERRFRAEESLAALVYCAKTGAHAAGEIPMLERELLAFLRGQPMPVRASDPPRNEDK